MEALIATFMVNPVFYVFAFVSVVCAIMMITQENPIYSALFLVVSFFGLAVIYVTLEAEFIAGIQVLVYTGAIMVLFLFVIMLLNLGRHEDAEIERSGPMKYLSVLVAFAVMLEIGFAARAGISLGTKGSFPVETVRAVGNVETLANVLFSQYLYAFEVAAVLLLLAMVGAVVIAKKNL